MTSETEVKSNIDSVLERILALFHNPSIEEKLGKELQKQYLTGLDDSEVFLSMNFVPSKERIEFIDKYGFDLVHSMNQELRNKLRKELQMGLMNFESTQQIKERLQSVLETTENRVRTIARTELVRARNMGSLDGARQSGLNLKKEWSAALDKQEKPDVCTRLNGVAVELNEHFSVDGEVYDCPPAHPNCKCVLLFVQK